MARRAPARGPDSRIYAQAGIPEYWIVDCVAETVAIHREPSVDGYRDVRLGGGAAEIAIQAFPDVVVRTTDIFA